MAGDTTAWDHGTIQQCNFFHWGHDEQEWMCILFVATGHHLSFEVSAEIKAYISRAVDAGEARVSHRMVDGQHFIVVGERRVFGDTSDASQPA